MSPRTNPDPSYIQMLQKQQVNHKQQQQQQAPIVIINNERQMMAQRSQNNIIHGALAMREHQAVMSHDSSLHQIAVSPRSVGVGSTLTNKFLNQHHAQSQQRIEQEPLFRNFSLEEDSLQQASDHITENYLAGTNHDNYLQSTNRGG